MKHAFTSFWVFLLFALTPHFALASDACKPISIITKADVTVSDGLRYKTETYFQNANAASFVQIKEGRNIHTVEGPFAWVKAQDEAAALASNAIKAFALGHQFHAMLLHFDSITDNSAEAATYQFNGIEQKALMATLPHGGIVYFILGENEAKPLGMVYLFEGADPIEISYQNWQDFAGVSLPQSIKIYDGAREFIYDYKEIKVQDQNPLWFIEAVSSPQIDAVDIYRTHRKTLIAHCMGDAKLMGALSAAQFITLDKGQVYNVTRGDVEALFTRIFNRVDYSHYIDLEEPIINVAESGDMATVITHIKTQTTENATGNIEQAEWAWMMVMKKENGTWHNASIASSLKP